MITAIEILNRIEILTRSANMTIDANHATRSNKTHYEFNEINDYWGGYLHALRDLTHFVQIESAKE